MESSPWGPKINIDCSREQLKKDMYIDVMCRFIFAEIRPQGLRFQRH